MKYNFEEITLRCEVSSRGGGIEIDLTDLGFPRQRMAAYQNYLGGGLLGRVQCNDTIRHSGAVVPFLNEDIEAKLDDISEALKNYFHQLTNPDDEWAGSSYESNQARPASAY